MTEVKSGGRAFAVFLLVVASTLARLPSAWQNGQTFAGRLGGTAGYLLPLD